MAMVSRMATFRREKTGRVALNLIFCGLLLLIPTSHRVHGYISFKGNAMGTPSSRERPASAIRSRMRMTISIGRLFTDARATFSSYPETVGTQQHSTRTAHDEITFRNRRGEVLSIPQAERYSTQDWIHNLVNWHNSVLLQRIKEPILMSMGLATILSLLNTVIKLPIIPAGPHSLLGGSLGLLLVFRTNASYSRFWEGRKVWEMILGKSRDLARSFVLYEDVIGRDRVTKLGKLLSCFPLVLNEHLTGTRHREELSRFLDRRDQARVSGAWNKPLFVCNRLGAELMAIPEQPRFSSRERLMMLALVNDLSHYLGACERIVQTPVPLSYARHTSRFLTIWLFTLPFVLVKDLGYLLILVMGLSTWALFGILEIGLLIEDPFQRILNLDVICDTVINDVTSTLYTMRSMQTVPFEQPVAPKTGSSSLQKPTLPIKDVYPPFVQTSTVHVYNYTTDGLSDL